MANEYDIIIRAQDKTGRTLRNIEGDLNRLETKSRGVTKALGVAGAALASFGASSALRGIVNTTRSFERYNTMLTTYLGSQRAANLEMARLQKLANNLPQDLEDITKAFVIFTRTGINTSSKSLTAFSNIATANGKSLEQLGEAVADALTGEYERLKEFGIKVSKDNDQFVADIGNGNKIIASSSADLVRQLQALGEEGGKFGEAAANNAKTLDQSFSNLDGAVYETAVAFGEGLKPELKAVVEQTSLLLRNNQELAKSFGAGLGEAIRVAADGLRLIGQNIDVIRNAILTFIAIRSAQYFATMAKRIAQFTAGAKGASGFIGGMGKAIRSLTIAPIAKLARFMGPAGLIATGALAVGKGISNLSRQTVKLGGVTATFGEVASAGFNMVKQAAVDAFNNAVQAAGNFVKQIGESNFIQSLLEGWEQFAMFSGGVLTAVAGVYTRFANRVLEASSIMFGHLQDWFGAIRDWAVLKFQQIGEKIVEWAQAASQTFRIWYDKAVSLVDELSGWFQWMFQTIGDYAKSGINFIINTFVAFGQTVIGIAENIPEYFGAMFRGIITAAGDFANAIVKRFSNIGEGIALALKGDFSGAMAKAGEEVGFSFSESIAKAFAEMPNLVPDVDYRGIFDTDRVNQAMTGLALKSRQVGQVATQSFDKVKDAINGIGKAAENNETVFGAFIPNYKEEFDAIVADFNRGKAAMDKFISPETITKIQNLGQTLVDMLPDEVANDLEDKLMRMRTAAAQLEYAQTRMEAEELRKAQEELAAATGDVADALNDVSDSADSAGDDLETLKKKATTVSGIISETYGEMSERMSRGIAEGIMAGKGAFNSFKDYLKQFANEVMTKIIDRMLIQPMMNQMTNMLGLTKNVVPTVAQQLGGAGGGAGGGIGSFLGNINWGGMLGGFGNFFSGLWGGVSNFFGGIWSGISNFFSGIPFLADGGYLPSGQVGVVGEAGPELITGPATVHPMSGGGEPVVVNFNINAIDTQSGTEFIMKNRKQITGVIQDAYNRRGKQGVY